MAYADFIVSVKSTLTKQRSIIMEQLQTPTYRDILVAVDVQNDFIDGSLAVHDGEQVIAPLNTLAAAVRSNLGRVAFTRDWHPAVTPHFDTWPVHCVADTHGAALHNNLIVTDEDITLNKGMAQTDGYSGIEAVADDGTTLESLITQTRADKVRVFVGGLATDYCVKATSIDLATRFADDATIEVYAVADTMRAVNLQPGDEAAAIAAIADAGVHITTLESALAMIDTNRLEQ